MGDECLCPRRTGQSAGYAGLGSVAWWDAADGATNDMGTEGHVAYIEDVSGSLDSYTITISEDAVPSAPFE